MESSKTHENLSRVGSTTVAASRVICSTSGGGQITRDAIILYGLLPPDLGV